MKASKLSPILEWLLSYRKEWLRLDLVAGLTTAAVVIPKAMAYAAIAGQSLVVVLYSSPLNERQWRILKALEKALSEGVDDGQLAQI